MSEVADDDQTDVVVCPSCAAMATAVRSPMLAGYVITMIVVSGADPLVYTAMARREDAMIPERICQGFTREEALFALFLELGVFH